MFDQIIQAACGSGNSENPPLPWENGDSSRPVLAQAPLCFQAPLQGYLQKLTGNGF